MIKTFFWTIIKQRGGKGLPHVSGTVEAHTLKEAKVGIDREIADYAAQDLVMGEYLLGIRTDRLMFPDRHIQICCSRPHLVP